MPCGKGTTHPIFSPTFHSCLLSPENISNPDPSLIPQVFPHLSLKESDSYWMLLVKNKDPKTVLKLRKEGKEGLDFLRDTSQHSCHFPQLQAQTSPHQTSTLQPGSSKNNRKESGSPTGPRATLGPVFSVGIRTHSGLTAPQLRGCTGPLRKATGKTSVTYPTFKSPTVDLKNNSVPVTCSASGTSLPVENTGNSKNMSQNKDGWWQIR